MVPTHLLRQLRSAQLAEVDGPAARAVIRAIDEAVGLEVPGVWCVLRRVPDLEGEQLAELRTDGEHTWWAVVPLR